MNTRITFWFVYWNWPLNIEHFCLGMRVKPSSEFCKSKALLVRVRDSTVSKRKKLQELTFFNTRATDSTIIACNSWFRFQWYFFVVKWPFLISLISETSLSGSTNIRLNCSYKCVTSETIKSFVSRTNGSSIWNGALISIGDLSESIVIAAIWYRTARCCN